MDRKDLQGYVHVFERLTAKLEDRTSPYLKQTFINDLPPKLQQEALIHDDGLNTYQEMVEHIWV